MILILLNITYLSQLFLLVLDTLSMLKKLKSIFEIVGIVLHCNCVKTQSIIHPMKITEFLFRYYACLCGHIEIVKYLLENGEILISNSMMLLMNNNYSLNQVLNVRRIPSMEKDVSMGLSTLRSEIFCAATKLSPQK